MDMKRAYTPPKLMEFGKLAEVTLGAIGSQPDFLIVAGLLTPDANSPTCQSNASACILFS
jgi:hypothetical protein